MLTYELQETDVYKRLITSTRQHRKQNMKDKLFHSIGLKNIIVLFFKLENNESFLVSYKNDSSINNFFIEFHTINITYSLNILKNNRVYSEYKTYILKCNRNEPTNIDDNTKCICISVGEILKHYYYTEGVKFPANDKINYGKFILKSLMIDSERNKYLKDHILGMLKYSSDSIELWTSYVGTFEHFCKQIIIFSPLHQFTHNSSYDNIFRNSFSKEITKKLIRYFVLNEDPEVIDSISKVYFSKPLSIPDVLLFLKENKYIQNNEFYIYQLITKKPNKREKSEEDKYSDIYVNSIKQVPLHYPVSVYKNIYVSTWNITELYNQSDYRYLSYNICKMISLTKNTKYKYKRNRTRKIPNKYKVHKYICSGHSNHDNWDYNRFHKTKQAIFQYIKREATEYRE